jgi:three-Cys-motif partner protein
VAGSDGFFETRNPQAVLKHGILTRYAYYFAGRAGQATGGRVAFIDGFAGEGRYEDGSDGSPLLLAAQAERAGLIKRDIKLAFVEPDADRRSRLKGALAEAGVVPDVVLGRPFESAVDDLLDRYSDRAILIFVDPFGLGITLEMLERILRLSSPRRPIDVLYHFSLLSVARMGRAALGQGDSSPNAKQLDAALGPVGWREQLAGISSESGAATRAALDIGRSFATVVAERTGVPSLGIPVRPRPDHVPKYLLTLFTKDPVGRALWDFADVAGNAHVDWLHHCSQQDYEANVEAMARKGVMSLFGDEPAPHVSEIQEAVKVVALNYLPDHLVRVIGERDLVPVNDIEATYGEPLGRARETHLRSALQLLIDDGRIGGDTKGAFRSRAFTRVR